MFDTATCTVYCCTGPPLSILWVSTMGGLATDGVKSKELFIKPRATHYRCITSVSLGDFRALGPRFRADFMGLCTREAGQPWLFMQAVLTLGPKFGDLASRGGTEFGESRLLSWEVVTVKQISSGSKTGSKAVLYLPLGNQVSLMLTRLKTLWGNFPGDPQARKIPYLLYGAKICSPWNVAILASAQKCCK